MRATFPFVQLAVLMACLPVSAQQPGESPLDWFQRMDRNQDGKLRRQEVPIPQFKDFDADGDGFVTQDEFKAHYTKPRAGVGPAKPAAQPAPATPGALFRRVEIPGFTDIVEGTNGIALADLNRDGLVDIVATYTEPNRGLSSNGHHLRVFINQGNFRFQMHPINIRESKLTGENFGPFPQIPNLADFNGDGLLDIFITRHSPFWAGKRWPGVEPLGNTLLLSDGAWDAFRDVSAKLGVRNETAYNRQSSIADVNRDGWLDIAIGCDNIGNAIGGVSHSRLYVTKGEGGRIKAEDGGMMDESKRAVSRSPDRDTRPTEGLPRTQPGDLTVGVSAGSGDPRRAQDPRRVRDIPHPSSLILPPFIDIGGTDLVPDFGGFYHDSAKDKAGPGIALRDLDNDGDLDLVQSFHCDVRQPLLPYSPGEYRQGVFCWKNLLAETGTGNGTGSDQDDRCLSQFPAGLRFEKITGNGLACEARLKYNRDRQLYEPVGKTPGLPYLFFADVDNDGLQDVLAIGPSDPGFAPRAEDVGGRFWHNLGHFRFQEATSAVGLDALNWTYRQWYRFFDVAIPPAAESWKPRRLPSQPGLKQGNPLDHRFYFSNAIFGDFDNDGWLDLVVLDRHESPTLPVYRAALFMNRGDGAFQLKPTTFSGLDSTGISGEAADLNNDGLLDIVIACDPDNSGGGRAGVGPERYHDKVYVNTGVHGARENHWLRLRFTGIKDAELIGARVELSECGDLSPLSDATQNHPKPSTGKGKREPPQASGDPASGKSGDKSPHSKRQFRWIHSNHSYKSGGAIDVRFGLGKATSADLKVTLPNGRTATFPGLAADRTHELRLAQP